MGGMSTRTISVVLAFALFLVAAAAGAQTAPYTRTEIVNATGNPTNDGTALLNAIANLSPTPSATDRWLIKLEPGTYDLGTDDLVMRQYVDIEGSGIEATTIQGNYDPTADSSIPFRVDGMVKGADDSEVRDLTVHCISSTSTESGACMAMSNNGTSPRLWRVEILANGPGTGSHWGIRNFDAAPLLEHVKVTANSTMAGNNYGIVYGGTSTMRLDDSEVGAHGATYDNVGILCREDTGHSQMADSEITATGGNNAVGIWFPTTSNFHNSLTIEHSEVVANGATTGTAIRRDDGTLAGSPVFVIRYSRIFGQEDAIFAVDGNYQVANSELSADRYFYYSGYGSIKISHSRLLRGGTVFGPGTCAGVTDGANAFYASTCP